MDDIMLEYYTSLDYYGYSKEEADKLLKLILIKYGNLSERELMEVLYNAMTSCNEENGLSLDERLNHIDGLWFVSRKYAMYRSVIKDYPIDDLSKIMINVFEKEQGDFLTDDEKEMAKLGILTGCVRVVEVEDDIKKKRL